MDAEAELRSARAGTDEVTFVGGEPTLSGSLVDAIAKARSLGFRKIGLQTNGSRLADAAFTASLAQAGLTDVHLSLHGSDAAVHDYHTGRAQSFTELLHAMQAARQNALAMSVTTVLTRSNFRVLAGIPSLLVARGVLAWFVSIPRLAGRAETGRDRIAPRLGLAVPFALHAIAAASALALPARIVGAPLCLLGPYATSALADGERAYASACETCAARPSCPGVDPIYLARFGGDELSPRDSLPPTARTTPSTFVGPGELAAPRETDASARRTRTSLPLYTRVKPAVAEVSSAAERRTGRDLKEILPALFDEDAKP